MDGTELALVMRLAVVDSEDGGRVTRSSENARGTAVSASRLWGRWGLAGILLAILAAGCANPVAWVQARLELKHGNLRYLAGDYRSAISHYDRSLAHRPASPQVILNKSYSFMALFRASDDHDARQGLADSAIITFRQYGACIARKGAAAGVDGTQVERHVLTLLLDSGQTDRAIAEVLQPRLARNPRDVATLLLLANVAFERGDLDLTLDCHRKRLALEPENPEAHYGIGVVAWKFSYYDRVLPERRYALLREGLQAATRATELRVDYADALTYVNLLYREMAKHARTEAERLDYEAKYEEFEARAKRAREAQRHANS